jgi:hypothetical protein
METRDKDQIVHYYDRSRRLANASANARYISEYATSKKRGILRSLTANRSLTFLFFTVVFCIVAVLGVGWLQSSRSSGMIAGNRLSVQAMWFEGSVYITVKRVGFRSGVESKVMSIKAGFGTKDVEGVLQSIDKDLRFRIEATEKPDSVAVIAKLAGGDEGGSEPLTLVALVE